VLRRTPLRGTDVMTPLRGTDVMALAGIVNVGVFLCGLAFLASRFGPVGVTAPCFLLVMLFMWGTGYGWSNEYYLSILPGVGPFPSTLAWGVSFFAFGLLHTWARRGGAARLGGATLLGTAAAAIHPLTALMFTLSFPALWVWFGRVPWRKRWAVLVYPCAALALALVASHVSVIGQVRAVFGGSGLSLGGTARGRSFLSPLTLLLALGPAPAGALLLPWVPRRWRRPLAAGMVIYAAIYLGGSLLGVPLAHRVLFFLVFQFHLAIALSLQLAWRRWRRARRLAGAAPVPAVVAASAMLLIPWAPLHVARVGALLSERLDVGSLSIRPCALEQLEAQCLRLRGELPPGSRIMAQETSAYHLAAFGLPLARKPLYDHQVPPAIDAVFAKFAARRAHANGATHILLRAAALSPRQRAALERYGAARTIPPDMVLLTLKGPPG